MIRYAEISDLEELLTLDQHVSEVELARIIGQRRVIVSEKNGQIEGLLRFGMFWDEIPFMNMLYVIGSERSKGIGTALADFWEDEMLRTGFSFVLTSTLSNEQPQHFYRKRGYRDCGSLILPGEPLEIILLKELNSNER